MKFSAFLLLLGALVLGGCKRGADSTEAIRQAVIDHLANRAGLNVASMQVDVVSVTFRQNEADATVSFRPKGAQGAQGMTMNYTLERKGSGWAVKGRPGGGNQHGISGSMPSGHPPVGAGQPPETPGAAQPSGTAK